MYLDHICSYTYPHLVDLMINPSIEESNTFINLILRHQQTLVSLSLHGVTTEILKATEGCSKLQQLQFTSLILTKPKQWASLHNQLWSRLKKLCAGQSDSPRVSTCSSLRDPTRVADIINFNPRAHLLHQVREGQGYHQDAILDCPTVAHI